MVESDYVECWGCRQRFVGGDLSSRLQRWREHAESCPANRDDTVPKGHLRHQKAED